MSITNLRGATLPIPAWTQGVVEEVDPKEVARGTLSEAENLVPLRVPRLATRGGSRIMLTLHDGVSPAPVFQAAGGFYSGLGALVGVAWPAHQTGDVALLLVQTDNEAATLSDPQGFVEIAGSPQGTGTAGAAGATRLTVFWARATSSAMVAPTVADSGDHQNAQILTFRGCIAAGNPWDVTAGDVQAAAVTAVSVPSATTTVDNCLVIAIVANATDTDTSPQESAWANASLTGLIVRGGLNSSVGNGGGFGAVVGRRARAGAYSATSATLATASAQGRLSVALKPPSPPVTGTELTNVVACAGKAGTGAVLIGHAAPLNWHFAYAVTSDMAFAGANEAASRVALPSTWDRATPARPVIANLFEKLYCCDATELYANRDTLVSMDTTVPPVVAEPTFAFAGGAPQALRPFCLEEYNNVLFIAGYGDEGVGASDDPALVRHSYLGRAPDSANGFDKDAYNTIGAKGDRVRAMRKGRGILLVAKANELYRITGFGKAYPGWQYQSEGVFNTQGFGVENPLALDHAGGYWFGIGKQGPFRTDGVTVESLVGPRLRTWRGIDQLGSSWVRHHPERNLMLFGVHPTSGAPDTTYPWVLLAWDLDRGVWQPNWKLAGTPRFFVAQAIATTTAPGPAGPPSAPSATAVTATGYTANWTTGDAAAETEVWDQDVTQAGAMTLKGVAAAGATSFALSGMLGRTNHSLKLRHRRNGVYTLFTAPLSVDLLIAPPSLSVASGNYVVAVPGVNYSNPDTCELYFSPDGIVAYVLTNGAFQFFAGTQEPNGYYKARVVDAGWSQSPSGYSNIVNFAV